MTSIKKTLRRILKDKIQLEKEQLDGIHVMWDSDEDLFNLKAMIVGPSGTPYENGFFFFKINYTKKYPFEPPQVKFITGDGVTRFNPNLYIKGKVCLSILGTWHGPSWTSSQNLSTVLLSIQSLLNENPIINEPGWEKYKNSGRSKSYNRVLTHQVFSVTVLDQLNIAEKNTKSPFHKFFPIMKDYFCKNFDGYLCRLTDLKHLDTNIIDSKWQKLSNGRVVEKSAIFSIKVKYNYSEILHELINLYHVYCPDELIYTPDELLLLEDFSKVGETTKPEETTIVKNVSKDVILFSDFEDETLKTKLLGLGAKFRKSISKKVTVIVFDDKKMNLKKTKTKIANAQKYDIAVFNRTDFNTYLTTS